MKIGSSVITNYCWVVHFGIATKVEHCNISTFFPVLLVLNPYTELNVKWPCENEQGPYCIEANAFEFTKLYRISRDVVHTHIACTWRYMQGQAYEGPYF